MLSFQQPLSTRRTLAWPSRACLPAQRRTSGPPSRAVRVWQLPPSLMRPPSGQRQPGGAAAAAASQASPPLLSPPGAAAEASAITEPPPLGDLIKICDLLPPAIGKALSGHPNRDSLLEVVMDLGRCPTARFPGNREERLSAQVVTVEDLAHACAQVGAFDADSRAGVDGTLHRISCLRNRQGKVVGLTCRAGRAIPGSADMVADLVRKGQSVLLLGRPGVGKTTAIRDLARLLADECSKRVVIVDTSNEIGGDGDIPHPAVGGSRRMQVAVPAQQHAVMIEAVENHMPQVVVIDEISTEAECLAARTIAQRGVQLVATAHGNQLENVLKNPTLADLVGGVATVTLGDEAARQRNVQKTALERAGPPTFDCVVEMNSRSQWVVHSDVAEAVDRILAGSRAEGESRQRGEDGRVQRGRASSVGPGAGAAAVVVPPQLLVPEADRRNPLRPVEEQQRERLAALQLQLRQQRHPDAPLQLQRPSQTQLDATPAAAAPSSVGASDPSPAAEVQPPAEAQHPAAASSSRSSGASIATGSACSAPGAAAEGPTAAVSAASAAEPALLPTRPATPRRRLFSPLSEELETAPAGGSEGLDASDGSSSSRSSSTPSMRFSTNGGDTQRGEIGSLAAASRSWGGRGRAEEQEEEDDDGSGDDSGEGPAASSSSGSSSSSDVSDGAALLRVHVLMGAAEAQATLEALSLLPAAGSIIPVADMGRADVVLVSRSRLRSQPQIIRLAREAGASVYAVSPTSTVSLLRQLCPLLGLDPLSLPGAMGGALPDMEEREDVEEEEGEGVEGVADAEADSGSESDGFVGSDSDGFMVLSSDEEGGANSASVFEEEEEEEEEDGYEFQVGASGRIGRRVSKRMSSSSSEGGTSGRRGSARGRAGSERAGGAATSRAVAARAGMRSSSATGEGFNATATGSAADDYAALLRDLVSELRHGRSLDRGIATRTLGDFLEELSASAAEASCDSLATMAWALSHTQSKRKWVAANGAALQRLADVCAARLDDFSGLQLLLLATGWAGLGHVPQQSDGGAWCRRLVARCQAVVGQLPEASEEDGRAPLSPAALEALSGAEGANMRLNRALQTLDLLTPAVPHPTTL